MEFHRIWTQDLEIGTQLKILTSELTFGPDLEVHNSKSAEMLTWKRPEKSDLKKTRFSRSHKPKIIEIGSVVKEKSRF